MARQCFFCPRRANSLEHAWPEWILDWLRTDAPAVMRAQFGERERERLWRTANGEIKIRYVCEGCNVGWMSQLEGVARPVLRPLITDFALPLNAYMQCTAAIWA